MNYITIAQACKHLECKQSTLRKIKLHVKHSLYRMNAGSADLYTFGICSAGSEHEDFHGGWAWSHSEGTWDSGIAIELSTGKIALLERG